MASLLRPPTLVSEAGWENHMSVAPITTMDLTNAYITLPPSITVKSMNGGDDTQLIGTQHNHIQHKDTQHKGLIYDPQNK